MTVDDDTALESNQVLQMNVRQYFHAKSGTVNTINVTMPSRNRKVAEIMTVLIEGYYAYSLTK